MDELRWRVGVPSRPAAAAGHTHPDILTTREVLGGLGDVIRHPATGSPCVMFRACRLCDGQRLSDQVQGGGEVVRFAAQAEPQRARAAVNGARNDEYAVLFGQRAGELLSRYSRQIVDEGERSSAWG